MNVALTHSQRLRAILDCILIALLALLAILTHQPAQAMPGQQPPARVVQVAASIPHSIPASADARSGLALSPLDDITLAWIIAAENAALTAPQYMLNIPIVTR